MYQQLDHHGMSLVFLQLYHKHLVGCPSLTNHILHVMNMKQLAMLLNPVVKLRDVFSKHRDAPSDSRDVPSNSRDVPSDSRDVPSDSRDVPSNSRDVPSDSRDVPAPSGTPYTDVVRCLKLSKDGHIKRPLNCFMLYSYYERVNVQQMHPDKTHSEISSILGKQWKALSHSEQEKYREKSKLLKEMHDAQFPSYRYKPKCKPKRRRSTAAREVKCSLEEVSQGSAIRTKKCSNQNRGTRNRSHLSDSIACRNQNVVAVVQTMPQLIRFIPNKPLKQEAIQPETLQRETIQQESLQPETIQPETIQQHSAWEPLQRYPLKPFLEQSSSSTLPADNHLPFPCDTDFADDFATSSAGDDVVLEWLRNINKELDDLESESTTLSGLQTQEFEIFDINHM